MDYRRWSLAAMVSAGDQQQLRIATAPSSVSGKPTFWMNWLPPCTFHAQNKAGLINHQRQKHRRIGVCVCVCVCSTSYLSSLEHTGWLHRISDLLAMGCEVCALLSVEAVSVLVAYETGRDITTQVCT